MIQELMKTGGNFYIWVKPTSKEEAIHVIQSDILSGSKDNFISYMEKRLKEERVKNYISNYYQRKQLFQQIVEGWSGLNEENKFLMNDGNAVVPGIIDTVDYNRFTINLDFAFFGNIDTAQHFNQCRFPRPIFSEQGVNFAGFQLKFDGL